MKFRYLLPFLGILIACGHTSNPPEEVFAFDYELLENLYYRADSVIVHGDTVETINYSLDTTVIQTGIFAYMQHDFELFAPPKLIILTRRAQALKNQGKDATDAFREIAAAYPAELEERLYETSDMNDVCQISVNAAMLGAYANEQLNEIDSAINILKPQLDNVESWSSRIHEMYIRLCVQRYGKERVIQELENCKATLQRTDTQPEVAEWAVSVFGARIGDTGMNGMGPEEAQASVDEIVINDICKLVN
ncbi:hypothetical protein [Chitinophaga sp.]|uniref:hypothetical protein n=1 Tax=Chitinophaga sp. TaxID=1869181 RepID=UPI0031DA4D9B